MAAVRKLGEVRTRFVNEMNPAILHAVLDDLLQGSVLNAAEVEMVTHSSPRPRDQARTLIDCVRNKGHEASLLAITSIQRHDVFLAAALGLTDFLNEHGARNLR